MAIYFFVVGLCFFLSKIKRSKCIDIIVMFFLMLFLCGGYMVGTDWKIYERAYYDSNILNEHDFEIGYNILQLAFSRLGFDFWTFSILFKSLSFIVILYVVKRFPINLYLFLSLFICEIGLYLFIDCPFRNMIAVTISLCAYKYLRENNLKMYYLYVGIASLFHLSALLLLFFPFIIKLNISNIKIVIIFILSYIIAFNINVFFETILNKLFQVSPLLKNALLVYVLNDDFVSFNMNIGSIYRVLILILLLANRNNLETMKDGQIIFRLSMFFLIIYPFAISLKIFNRFLLYEYVFYFIAVLYSLRLIKKKIIQQVIYTIVLCFAIFKLYTTITADYRYIPYTNYFTYTLIHGEKGIIYREDYNYRYSPYTD